MCGEGYKWHELIRVNLQLGVVLGFVATVHEAACEYWLSASFCYWGIAEMEVSWDARAQLSDIKIRRLQR